MPVPVLIGLSIWAWGAITATATTAVAGGGYLGRRAWKARQARIEAADTAALAEAWREGGQEAVELALLTRGIAKGREATLLAAAYARRPPVAPAGRAPAPAATAEAPPAPAATAEAPAPAPAPGVNRRKAATAS